MTAEIRTQPRVGPRPLPLHLMLGNWMLLSSFAALPTARQGLLPWNPALVRAGASLQQKLEAAPAEDLFLALAEETKVELQAFLKGLNLYRYHPYHRKLIEPPVIWQDETARLLDYGATHPTAANGWPILFIPSLINPAYILDLNSRRSLLRYLASLGLRPLLLDWGRPNARERNFTLENYIQGPLKKALQAASQLSSRPIGLVGYCMGGTLSLAAAQLWQDQLGALVLLATPWDFHAEHGAQAQLFLKMRPLLETVLDRTGVLPVDHLQSLFLALDPALSLRKFTRFALQSQNSTSAEDFVALEDWLNNGPDLAGPLARECLIGWYGENRPARRRWRIGGVTIDPARVLLPTLVVLPSGDRIVPPDAAQPLANLLPKAETLEPAAGHIGMIVGSKAEDNLWKPLGEWLLAQAKSL